MHHERIHLCQQLELLVVPFYLWYVLEYGWFRFLKKQTHSQAYHALRFEREAYAHDDDPDYLLSRPLWAFLNPEKNKYS